jgi:hypothetical protein
MRSPRPFLIALALLIAAAGAPAAAAVLVTVDKSTQRMTVEVDGDLRWTWPVSTGQAAYDTPSGRFTAFRMEADHFSKEWDDAPMPHSIFFTQKGHAIHGSLATSRLGTPASHGCVRLAPDNAARLFALVEQEGMTNTKVVLTGDVRLAMGRRAPRGRDPETDMVADEPFDTRPPVRVRRSDYRPPSYSYYGYGYPGTYYRSYRGFPWRY